VIETARRREDRAGLGGARPTLTPALPYLLPLAAAVAASAAGLESVTVLAAVAASAIVCAVVRAVIERTRIELVRERADEWIVSRTGQPPADTLLLARIDELTSARLRGDLARSFRRIAADAASAGRALTPSQHNRRALRPHIAELQLLADGLDNAERPVTPRGVALAYRLVTAGGGPLYNPGRAGELPASLRATLAALDLLDPVALAA
jgi:hypothetical protein